MDWRDSVSTHAADRPLHSRGSAPAAAAAAGTHCGHSGRNPLPDPRWMVGQARVPARSDIGVGVVVGVGAVGSVKLCNSLIRHVNPGVLVVDGRGWWRQSQKGADRRTRRRIIRLRCGNIRLPRGGRTLLHSAKNWIGKMSPLPEGKLLSPSVGRA